MSPKGEVLIDDESAVSRAVEAGFCVVPILMGDGKVLFCDAVATLDDVAESMGEAVERMKRRDGFRDCENCERRRRQGGSGMVVADESLVLKEGPGLVGVEDVLAPTPIIHVSESGNLPGEEEDDFIDCQTTSSFSLPDYETVITSPTPPMTLDVTKPSLSIPTSSGFDSESTLLNESPLPPAPTASEPPLPKDLVAFVEKMRSQYNDHPMIDTLGDWHLAKFLVYQKSLKAKDAEGEASKAILGTLDFRKGINYETIMTSDFGPHIMTNKLFLAGRTKTGSPILVWRASNHFPPPPQNPNPTSPHDLTQTIRFFIYTIENAKATGLLREQDRATVIIDRIDLKNENKDPALLKMIVSVLGTQYPEYVEKIFILPRNLMLMVGWGVIKSFLSPVIVNRIEILGSDYTTQLLKHIDRDVLLERYGGNARDAFLVDEGLSEAKEWERKKGK
ncbi:hypothetical protein HK097_007457, partial [Rhizophlyctis rosea]